ncbi:Pecanex-like protein 1 [Asanoa sp. NPDC049573]|uniref:Pecanex-like protein 1 n=1 Tax=Asanoa sp. NPDC049573 TaxID=3155396 RepID=UPI0034233406
MTRTRQAPRKNRRFIAVFATLAVFAGLVAVTQVSLAGSWRGRNNNSLPVCPPAASASAHDHVGESDPAAKPPADAPAGEVAGAAGDGTAADATDTAAPTGDAADATATTPEEKAADEKAAAIAKIAADEKAKADAQAKAAAEQRRSGRCRPATSAPTTGTGGNNGGTGSTPSTGTSGGTGTGSTPSTGTSGGTGTGGTTSPTTAPPAAPLVPLGRTCEGSDFPIHDGFQGGPKCVETQMGEVGAEADNPELLISRAPARVRMNTAFDIQVSTRNIVRDRFLGAAAGGYYLESSFLTEDGIVRGHFHVACRLLSGRNAQESAPVPAFFKAVEDGKGGRTPDTVTVTITPGLAAPGVAQCAAWAGDGSHRIPMMARANQIPAMDSVRVIVTR